MDSGLGTQESGLRDSDLRERKRGGQLNGKEWQDVAKRKCLPAAESEPSDTRLKARFCCTSTKRRVCHTKIKVFVSQHEHELMIPEKDFAKGFAF